MPRPLHANIISLGCPKNLVDAEVMCGVLASDGFILVNDREDADILLINTCGFIADARAEAEEEIQDALTWKKGRRGRFVVVSGCLPRRVGAAVQEQFPGVDLFLGLDDIAQAGKLLTKLCRKQNACPTSPEILPSYLYDHNVPRLPLTPNSFSYVKIAEGCDHRCAYCIIPYIRGNQRSRSMESILCECRQLLDSGRYELNLIAQDTTRYGEDLDDGSNLAMLLREIDKLPGDFIVRILYTHPLHLTDEIIRTAADCKHVAPYLDVPVQHISTPVLKAMRRGQTGEEVRERLNRLRELWPGVAVRTTFLLGFPGETEDDFNQVMEFCQAFRFDKLGAFAFSPEKDTPAAEMDNPVAPEIAQERAERLMELQHEIATEKSQAMVGKIITVIPEYREEEGLFSGRSLWDAPDVDNLVHFTADEKDLSQQTIEVQITRAEPYDLYGHAVTK